MIHYSKYKLNTFYGTPYFKAMMPESYPIDAVCIKSKSFHKLPENVKKLAALSKQWYIKTYGELPEGYEECYDDEGNELRDGKKLTEEEVNESWGDIEDSETKIKDIPIPDGGFSDPNSWEPNSEESEPDLDDYEGPQEETLLKEIKDRGAEYTLKYYGMPLEWASKDVKTLAKDMFDAFTGAVPLPADVET